MKIRNYRLFFALLLGAALLLSVVASVLHAAPQASNFVGTWQMAGGGGRGGGGNGGGGNGGGDNGGNPDSGNGGNGGGPSGGGGRGRGGMQTLVIAQNGDKYTVTHKTPRDEQTFDATVSGNTISWTEMRAGRDGNTMSIDYKATVDGDTMTGTMGGGQFSRPFTAKRGS